MKFTYLSLVALAVLIRLPSVGRQPDGTAEAPARITAEAGVPERAAVHTPDEADSTARAPGETKPHVRKPWPTIAWLGAVVAAIFAALMTRSRK